MLTLSHEDAAETAAARHTGLHRPGHTGKIRMKIHCVAQVCSIGGIIACNISAKQ
jgi:hypothetical protein